MTQPLQVVVLKPSKYLADGYVERFRRGFMPNSTVPYIRSMTPAAVGDTPVQVHSIDEYVHTDLQYLDRLRRPRGGRTLLALVGVQSHQFHRALDLAAYARQNGWLNSKPTCREPPGSLSASAFFTGVTSHAHDIPR